MVSSNRGLAFWIYEDFVGDFVLPYGVCLLNGCLLLKADTEGYKGTVTRGKVKFRIFEESHHTYNKKRV